MLQNIKLREYQEKALNKLSHMSSIGLFLGTGAGKTITSLARFTENPTSKLLIICPQKVITQWIEVIKSVLPDREILQFNKSDSSLVKNKKIQQAEFFDTIVVNFEIIHNLTYLSKMINNDWTVIVDESHKIKEMGTKRAPVKVTKAVLELGEKTIYKIILTATPAQKEKGGYIDYYSQLRFLGYFDITLEQFKDRYCIEKKIQYPGMPFPIKKITDYKNTDEIDNILANTCVRYIPKFNEYDPEFIQIKVDRCKSYNKLLQDRTYKDIICDNVSAFRIAKKTLAGGIITGHNEYKERFKYKDNVNKIEWLEEFITNNDEVLVIFYNYNVELLQLQELCQKQKKKFVVINGEAKDKYNLINKSEYDIVLGQFEACGESVDGLQYRSHICIFYSMPESSLYYRQALGRINRDGQKDMPIYYFLTMDKTIDTEIYKMIESKVEFNEEVLNKLNI